MKSLFTLLIFLAGSVAYAQTAEPGDQALDQIIESKVDEAIAESQYVRVPKEDFENIVNHQITATIDERQRTIVGFLVAIIGVLSALSIIQANRSRSLLKEQSSAEINNELNARLADFRKQFEELMNSKFEDLARNNKEQIELGAKMNQENLKNVELQLKQSKAQIDRSEEYLLNMEFEDLKKQIGSGPDKYTYEITLDRTINLLKNAEDKGKDKMIPEVVNLLTYIYYDYKQYNEVTALLDRYEGKTRFISTSYINAALTAVSDYHRFNSYSQRNKAIQYLDKSLELTQGYGQAQALKLEIFMMDYLRSDNDQQKEKATQESLKVLNDIIKSESNAPANETMSRLNSDVRVDEYKKYIDKLYELFPHELDQIRQKSDDYHYLLEGKKSNGVAV